MNENKFVSERTHTRIKFQPLTTSCHLVCLTEHSPAAQAVIAGVSYDPDRTLTPTVIYPDVRAMDPDRIFQHGPANERLTLDSLYWTVNGDPVSDVWTEGVDYAIDRTQSDMRGALTVMKNIPASDKAVLRFEGRFVDWRTNIVYSAVSDNEIALISTDKGADVVSCTLDRNLVTYDPLFDPLLVYDYKVAHGMPVDGGRANYVGPKCYEQAVTVLLTVGLEHQVTLPAGVTMRVVRLGSQAAMIPNSATSPELLLATYPTVRFDMRLIDSADYEIQFLRDGNIIARALLGLHTEVTMPFNAKPLKETDLVPSMKVYTNSALINLEDRIVEFPEIYYLIRWFTQAQVLDNGTYRYGPVRQWQQGEHMEAAIEELGVGRTYNDSYFDTFMEIDRHATRALVLDDDGTPFSDDDNTFLID